MKITSKENQKRNIWSLKQNTHKKVEIKKRMTSLSKAMAIKSKTYKSKTKTIDLSQMISQWWYGSIVSAIFRTARTQSSCKTIDNKQ